MTIIEADYYPAVIGSLPASQFLSQGFTAKDLPARHRILSDRRIRGGDVHMAVVDDGEDRRARFFGLVGARVND